MQTVTIQRLGNGEGNRLREIRIRALRDSPDSFATTLAEAEAFSREAWDQNVLKLPSFVAVIDGCDVGMARSLPHDEDPEACFLISLWVAPEARRRKVASMLIGTIVDWASEQGLKRLHLDVAEFNVGAKELYLGMGFVPNGLVGTLPEPRTHIREIQLVRSLDQ